jgi:hypothetical protein
MWIGRDRIANELLKLRMSPEEEAFAESFDRMVIEPMSGEVMNDPRQFAIARFRRAAFEKDQLHDSVQDPELRRWNSPAEDSL